MSRSYVREAPVLSACLELFGIRGWYCWRNNTGAIRFEGRFVRFGKVGSPDIYALVPRSGRLVACEVKRPGGRPTAAQRAFLRAVRHAGGVGLVVDDVRDLDRVLGRLEADPWERIEMEDGE